MKRAFLSRLVATCVALLALTSPVSAGEVTLAWNPNLEPNISGYILWYGTQSGAYTTSIDVGGRTTWTVTGLLDGQRYFFAAQAYNTARIVSLMSGEVSAELPLPPATPPPAGGSPSACTTTRPGPDWTCEATSGNWLPPGYASARAGGSPIACTTPRPGADWTCDTATGNWLPPGHVGTGGGSAGGCTTLRPGPDWTCNTATGGWLPPATPPPAGGSPIACTTIRPGPDWTCNTATGGWLPPGYEEATSSSSTQRPASDGEQVQALYLYDPVRGSPLTGWAELSPAQTGEGRVNVLRNQEKIGEWSLGPAPNDRGFTFSARSTQPLVAIGTELTVWQPSSGMWYVLKTDNGTDYASQAAVLLGDGAVGDRPVPGDYDGDGKTDVAVYRTSDRMWYMLTSSTGYTSARTVVWGEANDVPVPEDYDGDGKTDVAVWRPSTGEWLVLKSSNGYDLTQGYLRVQWGEPEDVPVPGDYDGDGKVDMATWRPSTGEWWVLPSASNYESWRGYLRFQGKAPADVLLRR